MNLNKVFNIKESLTQQHLFIAQAVQYLMERLNNPQSTLINLQVETLITLGGTFNRIKWNP
jgi:hypothetical protein